MTSKQCTRCKQIKPLDEFYLKPDSRDGHQCWCKDCMRAAVRATHLYHTTIEPELKKTSSVEKIIADREQKRIELQRKLLNMGLLDETKL